MWPKLNISLWGPLRTPEGLISRTRLKRSSLKLKLWHITYVHITILCTNFERNRPTDPQLPRSLTQKFSRAQLGGDASRSIARFPLTNANYQRGIELLQDWFGQSHRIIKAPMEAMLNLPNPSTQLVSNVMAHRNPTYVVLWHWGSHMSHMGIL